MRPASNENNGCKRLTLRHMSSLWCQHPSLHYHEIYVFFLSCFFFICLFFLAPQIDPRSRTWPRKRAMYTNRRCTLFSVQNDGLEMGSKKGPIFRSFCKPLFDYSHFLFSLSTFWIGRIHVPSDLIGRGDPEKRLHQAW